MKRFLRNFMRPLDWQLIAACFAASVFGIVLIISAVNNPPYGIGSPTRLVLIQIIALFVGMIAAFVISYIDYHFFEPLAKFLFPAGVLVLFVTGIVAPEIAGNKSWIFIGSLSVQPSEFIKLLFIITVAYHLSKLGDEFNRPKHLFFLFGHAALYILAVLVQKDMGMATIYALIFVIMLTVAGLSIKYYIFGGAVMAVSLPLIWSFVLKDRQRFRILTMFNPELDPLVYGYQVIQSKIAIGSGKFFGAGYMQGVLTQTNALPAKHTDFIFSVCGEELGFFGCMVLVSILVFIIVRIFLNHKKSTDYFGKMILIGVSAMFLVQVIINLGMCLGLTPVIGITLPFFSAGGSSMLSVWVAIGLVLSVLRNRKKR